MFRIGASLNIGSCLTDHFDLGWVYSCSVSCQAFLWRVDDVKISNTKLNDVLPN